MTTTKKIRINFVRRAIPTRGPFMSDEYNAAQEEASVDLNMIAERWNTEAYTLFNSLPRGSDETRWTGATEMPDPLADGLDGTTIFVDSSVTTGTLWDTTNNRPYTIEEFSTYIDNRITEIYDELSATITSTVAGLSDDQWDRLGNYIEDGSSTSLVTSLDYIARNARTDLDTLIDSVFGGALVNLSTSFKSMISDLLTLHGGIGWDSGGTVSHPEEGYIRTFIGKSASGSETPTYSSVHYVVNGTSLETAIGALDANVYSHQVSNLLHIANTSNPHQTSLQQAITKSGTVINSMVFFEDTSLAFYSSAPHYASLLIDGVGTSFEIYDGVYIGIETDINMCNTGCIYNLVDPVNDQDATTKSWVEANMAKRYQQVFNSHFVSTVPITVNHNLGILYPVVQVIDTSGAGGDYSGLLIDEVYTRERGLGLAASGGFVNIEYTDENSFDVYTDIQQGVIIYVC